jgi:hypothetical protein
MRLGFFQGAAAGKSLSRIYPVQAKLDLIRDPEVEKYLAFSKAKPLGKALVEFMPYKGSAIRDLRN